MLNPLRPYLLRHHLARSGHWVKYDKDGNEEDALPPMHVVQDMLADPHLPLPPLDRIVGCPIFTADGTLLDRPGYHPEARIYYAPRPGLVIPPVAEAPTPEEVARGRALLLDDLLVDFPFDGDAERAHAVALGLFPFVRELIEGCTPLHLVEKPTVGTGAGLLVRVLAFIALGHPPAVMAAAKDEDEWRKRITSILVTGGETEFVLIDNLPPRGRLDSAALSAAITAPLWADRILGLTKMVQVPVRCAWAATGNNPSLSSELARRAVRVRLDARMDRPWLRPPTEFKHTPLDAWVAQHRGELIGAALTLVRAWLAAGRPEGGRVLGEFEDWSRVIGGILDVAGIPGFLGNLDEFYTASDVEGIETRAFLTLWRGQYGESEVGVAELFPLAAREDVGLDLGSGNELSRRTALGILLRDRLRGRRFTLEGGRVVEVVPAGKRGAAALWKLLSHSETGEEKGLGRFIGLSGFPPITPEPGKPYNPSPNPSDQGLSANSSAHQEFPGPINLSKPFSAPIVEPMTGPVSPPAASGTSPVRVARTPLPVRRPEGDS